MCRKFARFAQVLFYCTLHRIWWEQLSRFIFSASKLQIQGKYQGLEIQSALCIKVKLNFSIYSCSFYWNGNGDGNVLWLRTPRKVWRKSLPTNQRKLSKSVWKLKTKPCNTVLASMYLIAKMLCKMLKRWITRLKNI